MDRETSDAVAQVTPYEGNEDFIFISYSHRDTATVLPLLQRMKEEGYRFWYDEGIDPGSEWPESIATHLNRCRVCLAFMSTTSLASQNCRREINFALSKNKEFLSVILEPVEMSPGMEMQISTYQSILKYKYRSEEQFRQRLLNVDLLQNCREPRKEGPAEKPVSAPPPPVYPAAQSAPTTGGGPQRPLSQAENRQASKPNTALSAGLKKWTPFAAGAAAVLLLLIIAVFSMGGSSSPEDIDPGVTATGKIGPAEGVTIGDTVYRDDKGTQRITGAALSAEQLQALSTFKKCNMLYLEECTLESGALDALSAMEQLNLLSLEDCQGVGDLSFLNTLPKLYTLYVIGCGVTDEQLAGFRGEQLTKLNLSNNALNTVPGLSDPSRVTELSLAGNSIGDLTALSAWTKLTTLDVSSCDLTSLAGIGELQSIKTLRAADNRISDLTPLTQLIYLSTLDLKNNSVTSLSPLQYCRQLSVVSLRNNPDCAGLDVLSGSSDTLTKLDISGLASVTSLDFLSDCGKLTRLYAEGCGLTGCGGLENCVALTAVSLAGNHISDLSGLADLTEIKYLNLADNEIEALPELGRLGADTTFPAYVFSNNKLVRLDNLPRLHYSGLMVDGNPLSDLSALGAESEGTYLVISCEEDTPLEPLTETGFSSIYATSVFIGKQAELERNTRYRGQLTFEAALEEITKYGNYVTPDF